MTDKIKVTGVAITEGTSRNGIFYGAEELKKFAPSLTNRPILKDHASLTDNVIGKVTNGESTDNGRKVMYSGWIKEDSTGIVEKIKDGRICEVSIGAVCGKLVKEKEDSDVLIAKDMTAMELSTTPTPGVQGTSISQTLQNQLESDIEKEVNNYLFMQEAIKISEAMHDYECPECEMKMDSKKELEQHMKDKHNKEMESYSMEKSNDKYNIQKEVKLMESTQEKKVEVTESENYAKEAFELKAKLLEANKAIESMKEAQRQEAIASYKVKCEAKKIPYKDVNSSTMETIKALIDVVDSLPSYKDEEKVSAKTKTAEVVSTAKIADDFDGYVIENSTLGGLAFYKTY